MHALIFDIDGTLTRTNDVDHECFVEAIRTVLEVPEFETDWDSYTHTTDQGIVEELALRLNRSESTPAILRQIEEQFISLLCARPASSFREVPGAGEFLCRLRGNDIPVAVATGAWRASAHHKLHQAGIDVSGLPVFTSSDAVSREDIMMLAHDALLNQRRSGPFRRTTSFGDAPWDIRATSRLGWNFVGVGESISLLRENGACHVFEDYTSAGGILSLLGMNVGD